MSEAVKKIVMGKAGRRETVTVVVLQAGGVFGETAGGRRRLTMEEILDIPTFRRRGVRIAV